MADEPVAVAEPAVPVTETPVSIEPAAAEPVAQTPPASTPQDAAPIIPPPAPVAPLEAPANLPPEVQEYVTRLEDQARTAREQSERQILSDTVSQYARRLEQQYGLAPEAAQAIAKTQGDLVYGQYQSDQLRRGQVRAAISIAKEFGIDPLQLIDLTSPTAMRLAAQTASAAGKRDTELTELRAKIAALEKGRVPPQSFSQGAQPVAGAGFTGDALESAWLKHETTQSDKPNPYDAAYRAMLRG